GWSQEEYDDSKAAWAELRPAEQEIEALVEELKQYAGSSVPPSVFLRRRISEMRAASAQGEGQPVVTDKDVMVTRVGQVLTSEGGRWTDWAHGDDGWVGNVACPRCGYEYSHIKADPDERFVILFEGECGHAWKWRIEEYKGICSLL